MISKKYTTPSDFQSVMDQYINSCKIANTIKLKDSETGEYLEEIKTMDGKTSTLWVKAPSVYGFCNFAQISRNDYYSKYRKDKAFEEICREFEQKCDEADMDCQYNRDAQKGAQWRLQLRGFKTDQEKEELAAFKEARQAKKLKSAQELETIKLKNKLIRLQIQKLESGDNVDPLITQLIKDMGIGGQSG